MNDQTIMFVKPKAISAEDKATLKDAGVIVIEIKNPADAKLVRAGTEIEGPKLLALAAKAVKHSDAATKLFGQLVCAELSNPIKP